MMLDFAIKYGDVLLDLEEGSQLTVEWYSTVFNEAEILRGSYSYPVQMKWTDKNLVVLGFPNYISNRMARKKIDVAVILFGGTWKNATMEIEISYERLSGSLLIDNSIIAEAIKETTLPDMFSFFSNGKKQYEQIDIGSTVNDRRAHMLATAVNPDQYPYAFPSLTNFSALGERTLEETAWINPFDWKNPHTIGYPLHDNYFYNPSFYLVWLIKTICTKLGFEAVGSFLDHHEVKTWQIFNTGYYSGREIKKDGFKIIPARHFPKLTVTDFLKVLRNDLKVMIYFDSLTRKAFFELSETILMQDDVYDYSGQVVEKTVKTTPVKDKAFNVISAVDDADESFNYLPYVKSIRIGEGELKKVELSIGSLFMNKGILTAFIRHPLRQPMVSQVANVYDVEFSSYGCYNKQGELSKNEFTFRIFSFRGLRANDVNNPGYALPYATTDDRDTLGNVVPGWIPTMLSANGFVANLASMFYRFLTWTEGIEFSSFISPKGFFDINPMRMGMIQDLDGSKNRFLIDRISFEPIRGVSQIFSKVTGFLYHKVFGLSSEDAFQVYELSTPDDIAYVVWRYIDVRRSYENGTHTLGKIQFLFFDDPFLLTPKDVSSLKVNYALERTISTGAVDVEEYNFTTGDGVYEYTTLEFTIETILDPYWKLSTNVILRESDDESYMPV